MAGCGFVPRRQHSAPHAPRQHDTARHNKRQPKHMGRSGTCANPAYGGATWQRREAGGTLRSSAPGPPCALVRGCQRLVAGGPADSRRLVASFTHTPNPHTPGAWHDSLVEGHDARGRTAAVRRLQRVHAGPRWSFRGGAGGGGGSRDASEGKGRQRRPQQRLGRRLEEVAKAVGGGYRRLQTPLRLALALRETVAGHRLGALEGGGGGADMDGDSRPQRSHTVTGVLLLLRRYIESLGAASLEHHLLRRSGDERRPDPTQICITPGHRVCQAVTLRPHAPCRRPVSTAGAQVQSLHQHRSQHRNGLTSLTPPEGEGWRGGLAPSGVDIVGGGGSPPSPPPPPPPMTRLTELAVLPAVL